MSVVAVVMIAAAPAPPSTIAFAHNALRLHGYFVARIPSIVLADDTLVALAECNLCATPACTSGVAWRTDLCSKRSHDDGNTWTNFSVVVKDGSQPSLVYDELRAKLVLNCNVGRRGVHS